MAFLVCLLFRESIGVAITKSFVIFVRNFFVSIAIGATTTVVLQCSNWQRTNVIRLPEIKTDDLITHGNFAKCHQAHFHVSRDVGLGARLTYWHNHAYNNHCYVGTG